MCNTLNLKVKHGMKLIHESIIKVCKLMIKIKNSTCFYDNFHLLCNLKNIKYLKSILDSLLFADY